MGTFRIGAVVTVGYPVRREVREALPPGLLTAAERNLVMEIADDVRDDTREGWPGSELLSVRADIAETSIPTLLARIAEKWCELRVEIGTDSKGRPIYARHGHRTIFRFPPVLPKSDRRLTLQAGEGKTAVRPSSDLGPAKSDPRQTKVRPSSTPSPQCSSEDPQISLTTTPAGSDRERDQVRLPAKHREGHRLLASLGATDDERPRVVAWITEKHNVRSGRWWRTCHDNGDLANWLAEWRADHAPRIPQPRAPEPPPPPPEVCGHGVAHKCDDCRRADLRERVLGLAVGGTPRKALKPGWQPVYDELLAEGLIQEPQAQPVGAST